MKVLNQYIDDKIAVYNGDSCETIKDLSDNSVHYSIFSPPFASLYVYSNSERDLGNCKNHSEFFEHFNFIIKELFRIIKPGRLCSFHCMDIPLMKERDGHIGLMDFPGELIKMFQAAGFIYHSRVVIWKDPLVEATRTKAIGLMHKQLQKDSAMCRNGLPDYVVTMRKPGNNDEPIAHPSGFHDYVGDDEPIAPKKEANLKAGYSKVDKQSSMAKTDPVYSHHVWRRYASPVWMDINQSNTLQRTSARDEKDERHICPLQLDVIARCLELWSNPDDIVYSPFMGIGSEGYEAILRGRRFIGCELKESYYRQAEQNVKIASTMANQNQAELFK